MDRKEELILIDSNIVIAYHRGDRSVMERARQHFSKLAFPTMVVFEIESGLYKSGIGTKRMENWQWLVSQNIVLPMTKEIATLAAMLKANLDRAGTMVSGPDLIIAATAIRHNAPLATRNIREFSRIPDLTIEAW